MCIEYWCNDNDRLTGSVLVHFTENSVLTSQRKERGSITNNSQLMLFREIIGSYFKNNTKQINALCGRIHSFFILQ